MIKVRKGFTLIELVVAVAIILVIASIVLVGVMRGKVGARDKQRIADLNTIAQALSQYYTQNGSYPYWEMTKNEKGIFNRQTSGDCGDAYPCIYDATSGSSWRVFMDNFLKSRPTAPKKGQTMQYFYNASPDNSVPPTHFALGVRLEGSSYTASKNNSDPWYTTGYCRASACQPQFPGDNSDVWFYVVGQ